MVPIGEEQVRVLPDAACLGKPPHLFRIVSESPFSHLAHSPAVLRRTCNVGGTIVSERPFSQASLPLIVVPPGALHRTARRTRSRHSRRRSDAGAGAVEFDVRVTADGHAVVIHDAAVDRTTDGAGPRPRPDPRGDPVAAIARVRRRVARVPTLHEVLARFSGRVAVDIEIKNLPGDPDFDRPDEVAVRLVHPSPRRRRVRRRRARLELQPSVARRELALPVRRFRPGLLTDRRCGGGGGAPLRVGAGLRVGPSVRRSGRGGGGPSFAPGGARCRAVARNLDRGRAGASAGALFVGGRGRRRHERPATSDRSGLPGRWRRDRRGKKELPAGARARVPRGFSARSSRRSSRRRRPSPTSLPGDPACPAGRSNDALVEYRRSGSSERHGDGRLALPAPGRRRVAGVR